MKSNGHNDGDLVTAYFGQPFKRGGFNNKLGLQDLNFIQMIQYFTASKSIKSQVAK
jgi:hypothetical protein